MRKLGFVFVGMLMSIPLLCAQSTSLNDSAAVKTLLEDVSKPEYKTQLSFTVEDAVQYAIQQNRSLQNAGLDVQKAHAQRWQTIAAMLPQADASMQYVNMLGYEMDFSGMKLTMPNYITAGATVSVGLNGQAIIGALLNNIAIEMQDITRKQSESELRANVIQSYVAVLVMEDIVDLLDSSLVNIEKLAEQTKMMAAVGTVEQTQADQILVKVNTLKNSVKSNQRSLQLSYNTLRVLLNVDMETELRLVSSLEQLLSTEKTLGVLMEDFQMENNFSYQLLQKNVDVAKKNLAMAGWAYGPTVGASYQYTYRHNFSDGGFNMTPPHMLAVSVSMPIWSSGKRASAVTEKKIALREAENTLSETTDNLAIQYQQLRYNLANAYETYENEKENIDVTQRVMKNVTNKFNWGAASSLELTNASNDLISAQSTYVQAVMSLIQAEVNLEKFLNNK